MFNTVMEGESEAYAHNLWIKYYVCNCRRASSCSGSHHHYVNYLARHVYLFLSQTYAILCGPWKLPTNAYGPVAQLGARLHGMQKVRGSSPLRSTKRGQRRPGTQLCLGGVLVRKDAVSIFAVQQVLIFGALVLSEEPFCDYPYAI